jgi:hypothetical protein
LVFRERSLSRIGRDSLAARASADIGMECILYKDKNPSQFDPMLNPGTFIFNCGRDNSGNPVMYEATYNSAPPPTFPYNYSIKASSPTPNGPCFTADLTRSMSGPTMQTTVSVYGYNVCDQTDPTRVQRGILAEY